jgi:hypothetical protein
VIDVPNVHPVVGNCSSQRGAIIGVGEAVGPSVTEGQHDPTSVLQG